MSIEDQYGRAKNSFLEDFAVLMRKIFVLICCLTPAVVMAGDFGVTETPEVVPVPDQYAAQTDEVQAGRLCRRCANSNRLLGTCHEPWWYWWHACHGREPHCAYLPPYPGHYYFRPYSVSELKVQQEAVKAIGGDPRNPYGPIRVDGRLSMNEKPIDYMNQTIIKWPTILLDKRFAAEREKVEAPYRAVFNGQGDLTAMDFQNMVNAAGHMRAILAEIAPTASPQDVAAADIFLDRLTAEARQQARLKLAEMSNRQIAQTAAIRQTTGDEQALRQNFVEQSPPGMPIPPLAEVGFVSEDAKPFGAAAIGLPVENLPPIQKPFEPEDEVDEEQE